MRVKTVGRKVNLKQNFNNTVEKRLQKFDRFFDGDAEATVTVTVEKGDRQTVEITLKNRGLLYRTERTAHDMETAFSEAADLMMRQIVKNKEKLGNRIRAREVELAQEEIQFVPEVEGEDYRIVREKRFRVEAMTEEEAVLQMELLGHTFFMFRNSTTNEINVVYRRHDDSFGVLIPVE